MICPACGARNSERAAWCTQCYAVLGGAGDDTGADDTAAPDAADTAAPVPASPSAVPSEGPALVPPVASGSDPSPGDAADPVSADGRDVRVQGEEVEWRCSACGTWSSLLDPVCRGCGSPRAGFVPEDQRSPRPPRAGRGATLAATVLLPGLGHLLRGPAGLGSAVLLLWLLWAGGAVVSRGAAGPLPLALALAAAALWAGSLADVWQRLEDRAPVLSGRMLAWSTVLVTGLLVLLTIAGRLGQTG